MTSPTRALRRAAVRHADAQTERLRQHGPRPIICDVTAVAAGGAADNNALVTVSWRGEDHTAAGYASSYTPVVGHRVVCHMIDSQIIVAFRVVGAPAQT